MIYARNIQKTKDYNNLIWYVKIYFFEQQISQYFIAREETMRKQRAEFATQKIEKFAGK